MFELWISKDIRKQIKMTNSKNLSRRDFIKAGSAAAIGFMLLDNVLVEASTKDSRPNILWITSEDNSAYFTHCYGNNFATTPNIDKLAKEGFLYTHAYSVSPVCAPARNSILTGVYAASNGNENMRSNYAKSKIVKTYPEFLREAGYYCTNNSKTDYNTSSVASVKIWDEAAIRHIIRTAPKENRFLPFLI
jgi:N-sulfoglucosamine sulfohydrolase